MNHYAAKTAFAALVAGGLLAGCATTVDMGGPLGHYRYNYDSRLVSETVTVPERTVTYRAPEVRYTTPSSVTATTTYSAPVTTYNAPVTTTWRESRVIYPDPVVTYYEPRVVLEMHPSPSLEYKDHGQ